MNIQFITYNGKEKLITTQTVTENSFCNPQSFSEFDINIISLQDRNMWCYDNFNTGSLDCINDLISMNKILKKSLKPVIVFIPQNCSFKYLLSRGVSNTPTYKPIKDMLHDAWNIILGNSLLKNVYNTRCSLVYENCNTLINNTEYNSAFVFDTLLPEITTSKSNNSITTCKCSNNCYLSSLDLAQLNIDDFLREIGLLEGSTTIPDWLKGYDFYNDNQLKEQLKQEKERLRIIQEQINETNDALSLNMKYKSILVDTGDSLVETCFDILQKILNCDLSEFIDEKKADFIIKKPDITFVGEIKGISSNVKRGNISQVQRHCDDYKDELDEQGITENVKGILIITHQREKQFDKREEVHVEVVKTAEKNDILIITTDVLLNLFEKHLNQEISPENMVEKLRSHTGLLTFEQ